MFSRFRMARAAVAALFALAIGTAVALYAGAEAGAIGAELVLSVAAFCAVGVVTMIWGAVVYGDAVGVWAALLVATSVPWLAGLGCVRFQLVGLATAWVVYRVVRLMPDPTVTGCCLAGAVAGVATAGLPVAAGLAIAAAAAAAWRAAHPLAHEYPGRVARGAAMALLLGTAVAGIVSLLLPDFDVRPLPPADRGWPLLFLLPPVAVRSWRPHRRLADLTALAAAVALLGTAAIEGQELAGLAVAPLAVLAAGSLDYAAAGWQKAVAVLSMAAQLAWLYSAGPPLTGLLRVAAA